MIRETGESGDGIADIRTGDDKGIDQGAEDTAVGKPGGGGKLSMFRHAVTGGAVIVREKL
jgi:hypothetical protein